MAFITEKNLKAANTATHYHRKLRNLLSKTPHFLKIISETLSLNVSLKKFQILVKASSLKLLLILI